MCLEASVIFWQIRNKEENLIPKVMKGFSLDTLPTAELTGYTI
jgi:hypothetical protein